jgi:hypothetical protein
VYFDSSHTRPRDERYNVHPTGIASQIIGADYRYDRRTFGGVATEPVGNTLISAATWEPDPNSFGEAFGRVVSAIQTYGFPAGAETQGHPVSISVGIYPGAHCAWSPFWPIYYGDAGLRFSTEGEIGIGDDTFDVFRLTADELAAAASRIPTTGRSFVSRFPYDRAHLLDLLARLYGIVPVVSNGNAPVMQDKEIVQWRAQNDLAEGLNVISVGSVSARSPTWDRTSDFTWGGGQGVIQAVAVEPGVDGDDRERPLSWWKPEVVSVGELVRQVGPNDDAMRALVKDPVWGAIFGWSGGDTFEAGGTSIASPLVAGIAAWVRFRLGGGPVPAELVRAIVFVGSQGYGEYPAGSTIERLGFRTFVGEPYASSSVPATDCTEKLRPWKTTDDREERPPGPWISGREASVFGAPRLDAAMLVFDEGDHWAGGWDDLRSTAAYLHRLDPAASYLAAQHYDTWITMRALSFRVEPRTAYRLVVTWNASPRRQLRKLETDQPTALNDRYEAYRIVVDVYPLWLLLDCGRVELDSFCSAPYRAFDFVADSEVVWIRFALPVAYAGGLPAGFAVALRPAPIDALGEDWEIGGYHYREGNTWERTSRGKTSFLGFPTNVGLPRNARGPTL